MSMMRCSVHGMFWDSDKFEECPWCANEIGHRVGVRTANGAAVSIDYHRNNGRLLDRNCNDKVTGARHDKL